MKRTDKKGFTIVELVIVIAVIAILAAVLIPNISRLVRKANESSDLSLVRNLNTALTVENKDYATAHEAFEAVKDAGYDLTKIEAKADTNKILYDSVNKCFVYQKGNDLEYYPNSYKTKLTPNDYYKLWSIETVAKENGEYTYSVYWNGENDATVTVKGVGFDAGSKSVTKVIYNGENAARNITIRTKGMTAVEINGYVSASNAKDGDVIYHYGEAGDVTVIKCASASYHVFGEVKGTVTVKAGHVAVEAGATVGVVAVADNASGSVKITNKGTVSVVNTKKAPSGVTVDVKNEGAIDVAVGSTSIEGTQPSNTYTEVKKLTSDTHEITEGGYYDGTGVIIETQTDVGTNFGSYALRIATAEKVVINGLQIKGNIQGILVSLPNEPARNFTLIGSEITGTRALCIKGSDTVKIESCKFSYQGLVDYDKEVKNKTQGILINNSGANLTIKNSVVQGFAYSVYTSEAKNILVSITDTTLKGRAGIATIDTDTLKATFDNCVIHGVNGFTGNTEVFGNITTQNVDNNNKNIEFTIKNCDFSVQRLPATKNNYQFAVSVDYENTKLVFEGENTFRGVIAYAEELTNEQLAAKKYGVVRDARSNATSNDGFSSVEMVISSSNGNSVSIKIK